MHPRMTALDCPMPFNALEIHVLRAPTNGLIAHITTPMSIMPRRGMMSIGIICEIASGSHLKAFLRRFTIQPPRNPASRAPRNPDIAAVSPVTCANVHPSVAIEPPTNPTARPGLSAILSAINPASTGSMNPNPTPPILLKNAAAAVNVPKEESLGAPAIVSIRNARAIMTPPPTTNGSMYDTPFIRCL